MREAGLFTIKSQELLARGRRGGARRDGRRNAVGFFGAAVGGALLAVAGAEGKRREAGSEQNKLFHNYKKTGEG